MDQPEELQQAIAALEALRPTLGDKAVDEAISPLLEKYKTTQIGEETSSPRLRYVTVLFVDVVGSTRLEKDLDPEDILLVMDGALLRFQNVVEEYKGRVLRFMGDGLSAIFGSPIAREDDARRAVRSGLGLLKVAEQVEQEVKERWKLDSFQIRVGINTGQVIIGAGVEAENSAIGMTTNIAKRMEGLAPPGGVLISYDTYRLVHGYFEFEDLPPVIVKGKDEPIQTYLVRSAKSRQFYPRIRGVAGVDTRMVGREAEFKRLTEIYHRCVSESSNHIVTIIGPAGIGKSRLLDEFDRYLQTQYSEPLVFKGRASYQLSQPYGLLRDLFANYLGIMDNDPVELVRQKLLDGLQDFFGDEAVMKTQVVGALLGFDFSTSSYLHQIQQNPEQFRGQAVFYLTQLLAALTRQHPAVWLLEDLHWSDDPSLEILGLISQECAWLPFCMITTARPDLSEQYPQWGANEPGGCTSRTTIYLNELSAEQTDDLIRDILQHLDPIPEQLRHYITSVAEGNPFYIEELVKMLIEDRIIFYEKDHDSWRIENNRLQNLQVPPTLTALLQARFDRLNSGEKIVLQQAAVIGRVFWDVALQILQNKQAPPYAELQSLKEREVIFDHEDSVIDHAHEYSYQHALMREVVYQTILKYEKQSYHAETAKWLSHMTADSGRGDEYASIIAEHYLNAGDGDNACSWYLKTGKVAKTQGATKEALRFFNLAMENLPTGDDQRLWEILLGRDEVLGILGDYDARAADDDALISLAHRYQDDGRIAEAYYRKGYNASSTGDERSAIQYFNTALEAAERAEDRRLASILLALKVICNTRLGDFLAADEDATTVLEQAEMVGEDETLARVLTNLAIYYSEIGDVSTASELTGRAVEINHRRGERMGESIGLGNLGYQYTVLGRYDAGIDALEQALRISTSIGARHTSAYHRLNLGFAYLRNEQISAACGLIKDCTPEMALLKDNFGQAVCNTYLGLALEESGEIRLARDHYQKSFEIMEMIGILGYSMDARAGLARCALGMGQVDEAVDLMESVHDYMASHGAKGIEFPILAHLTCVDVCAAAGDEQKVNTSVRAAYQLLMELSEAIRDPELKQSFLQNVPEHRRVQLLWHEMANK